MGFDLNTKLVCGRRFVLRVEFVVFGVELDISRCMICAATCLGLV